jgi:hypothetical protein
MADKIQLRRGLSTFWTSTNPTLSQGEIGIETDTGRRKIGDGTTVWTGLGYDDLHITPLTEINAALVDADEIPVYDLSATANRKSLLSRIWTYISGKLTATANTFTANQIISVADNTNAALRITQTGNGNCLVVEDEANPDSSPFVIDANGNVGIGTTTISARAHIVHPTEQLRLGYDDTKYTSFLAADSGTLTINAYGVTAGSINLNPLSVSGTGVSLVRLFRSVSTTGNAGLIINLADNTTGSNHALYANNSIASYLCANNGTVLVGTSTDNASGAKLQVNGAITAGDGTASLPAYSNTDDPDTGMYFIAADTVGIATNGAERVRINSAGNWSIGGNFTITNIRMRLGGSLTGGTTSSGFYASLEIQPDATSRGSVFVSLPATAVNAAPTVVAGFQASQGTFNGIPANQYGFEVTSSLTGATNNFGFHSNIAAATGRWNFYANGTANNYFAGNVGIGTTTISARTHIVATTEQLRLGYDATKYASFTTQSDGALALGINGTERARVKATGQVRFLPLSSAPSEAEAGDVYYNSTDNKLYCHNGTTWNALF